MTQGIPFLMLFGGLLWALAVSPAQTRLPEALSRTCPGMPAHVAAAAASGDADAQAEAGLFLLGRSCGETDIALGVDLLEGAANRGHAGAAARLGFLFDMGETGARDEARALRFYRMAAAHGHKAAAHRLGLLLVQRSALTEEEALREEGLYWLGVAAGAGDGAAAAALGLLHARGLHGVPQDVCLALDWYEASALLGAPHPLDALRAELADRSGAC
jgi:uncharacterized protein